LESKNSIELIQNIQKENLYAQTVQQLNKDFQLANIDKTIEVSLKPNELKEALNEFLLNLFTNHYDSYLNLLYIVDVSEKELRKVSNKILSEMIEEISFLILKREFQKVWLKKRYSK